MKVEILQKATRFLVCPQTKLPLELLTIEEAEHRTGRTLVPRPDATTVKGRLSRPIGRTPLVLLRQDLERAYPVVEGIPILLAPEALAAVGRHPPIDLCRAQYSEAYSEMEYYNRVGGLEAARITESESHRVIAAALDSSASERDAFPNPKSRWLDATYDCLAQFDAFSHLLPVRGRAVLQLGGKGTNAVKLILAGAEVAWVVTPMLGEALCSEALARVAGVADRLRCIVAVAEELPLRQSAVDAVYSGGCLHHTQTELAFPEAARVLRHGGKFASIDPWRAPFYGVGTRVFGQREPSDGVFCTPLTSARIEPARKAFSDVDVVQHGTVTRYPLIALSKLGLDFSIRTVWNLGTWDDRLCSLVPGVRRMGSSVAVLARR